MNRVAAAFVLGSLLLGSTAATAAQVGTGGPFIQCNYDLTNTGHQDAYDVAVVITGTVVPGSFVNAGFGKNPDITTSGGQTTLHWDYSDPTYGAPIKNGDKIHVGYTPSGTNDCPVIKIYWTNKEGKPIASSYIGVAYNHYYGTQETITNRSPFDVEISNVRIACQAAPLPLDALNATNNYLSTSMVTIGESATLGAGESWEIPFTPPCSDCYCVTNFETRGEGSDAIFSPWVQEYVAKPE